MLPAGFSASPIESSPPGQTRFVNLRRSTFRMRVATVLISPSSGWRTPPFVVPKEPPQKVFDIPISSRPAHRRMRREKRRDLREPQKVTVTVNGLDDNGRSFEEQTETIDLSESGVSFYLDTPIFVRSFLSLNMNSNSLLTGKLVALVARIETSRPGKQLIAAQLL
jgi:PilZ domain-containing protein